MMQPPPLPARRDTGSFLPVAPAERIALLDVLRGFALLGILLMNIEFFTRPLQGTLLGLDPSLTGIDYVAGWTVMAFVQGKFWTLFSMLFGMGFALMVERADGLRADPGIARIYTRRLLALLAIGLVHTLLIWPGDILVPYALGGFVLLLLFRNTGPVDLMRMGILFYLIPLALLWLSTGVVTLAQLDPAASTEMMKEIGKGGTELREAYVAAVPVYRDGGYLAVTAQRVRDSMMQYGWLPMLLPTIVGIFLLGAWFLRSGAIREPLQHLGLFRRLVWLGGPVGTAMVVFAMQSLVGADLTLPTLDVALGTTLMHVGSLLLCLAYLGAIVLLVHGPLPALREWLGPVGRMALTNYLLQSLVFSTLFYGYGFGLWGQVPRVYQVLLAFAFFGLQVLLSRAWLAHFRYGPVEWLWRGAAYGRLPAMRV